MKDSQYLSEEELENLINEIESSKPIPAPPDILSDILQLIHETEQNQNTQKPPIAGKKWFAELFRPPEKGTEKEFRRYCIRVAFCSAAVIAMLFLAPELPDFPQEEIPSRNQVLTEQKVRTKEEVLQNIITDPSSAIVGRIPWITQLFN